MTAYKAIKVNGKKIDEHRYIMKQHIGRPLKRHEVVHHKNGDKRDNRLCNLEIMDLSQHSKDHRSGKTLTEETKAKLSEMAKGNKHRRSLTDGQIQEIKALHIAGLSQRKIAATVGTNHWTVGKILRGQYYK